MSETKRSGFEDQIPDNGYCKDLAHQPPMFLHIPAGKNYRHVCPSCGYERLIRGHALHW